MNAYDHAIAVMESGMVPACIPLELDGRRIVVVIPWSPTGRKGRNLLSRRTHPSARAHFICESLVRCRQVAEEMGLGDGE